MLLQVLLIIAQRKTLISTKVLPPKKEIKNLKNCKYLYIDIDVSDIELNSL